MNIVLWTAASVLALGFAASGAVKLVRTREQVVDAGFGWAESFSRGAVKRIGVAEVAGAVGLVVPPASGIASILSPIAATCLALLMVGAVVVHIRREETGKLGVPAVLLVLTAALAVGRFVLSPF